MAGRTQPMVLQLDDGAGIGRGTRPLCRAVRYLRAPDAFRAGSLPGLSRKRGALFRALRSQGTDLSLCLHYLCPDGAVVGAAPRCTRESSSCTCGIRTARARRSLSVGLFLGDLRIFYALRIAP